MALDFPNIDPVALSLGPLQIRWYALSYLAGILIGWFVAVRLSRLSDARPNESDIEDFVPWAVLGVILGGRLGYVLFYNLPFYLDNPAQLLQVWQGGMSFHGGASGVIIAVIAYAIAKRINVLKFGDIIAVIAPIGLCFGRVANFINGELFGRVTDVIGYGAARAFVELFREPDAHIGLLGGVISMGQVLSLPMIVIGAAFILYAMKRKPV